MVAAERPPTVADVDRLRRLLGGATAAMAALSWPLWAGRGTFPRVPFVREWPAASGAAGWALLAGLVGALLGFAVGTRWRLWYAASLGLFVALILADQHRFQPWAYQYAMTSLLLAALPTGTGLRFARWWFVSIYVHSGLSKLDRSFCDELGPLFLRQVVRPFGADPSAWPAGLRIAGVLAMPAGEILVGALLLSAAGRRLGRVAALGLHAALIGVLGPWGLGHSPIVLAWNAATAAEVWVAFRPGPSNGPEGWGGVRGLAARAAFWAGVVLPVGERGGWFDAWPSHALYASHVGRVAVAVHRSELGRYPGSVLRHVDAAGSGPWCRVDLTAWSRAERGTPPYPQVRAGVGLAEDLAVGYGGPALVRLVVVGAADRFSGRRARTEAVGPGAIRRLGVRLSRVNARPAPRPGQGSADPGPS